MSKSKLDDDRTLSDPMMPNPHPEPKKSQMQQDIESIMQGITELAKAQRELNERWNTELVQLRALARGGKF